MKKLLAILLALMLMMSGSVVMFADSASVMTLTFGDVVVELDDEDGVFEMAVVISNNPGVASFAGDFIFDDTVMKLTAMNTSAFGGMLTFDPERAAKSYSWFNTSNITKNDLVFATLTFELLEGAKPGEYEVTMTCEPDNVANEEYDNVPFEIVAGTVTIPCPGHDYKYEAIEGDDDNHNKICKVCNETTKVPHSWSDGEVTTDPTCTKPGVTTYTCADCGATKTEDKPDATGEHSYGEWEDFGNATQHRAKCSVCELYTFANHTWNDGEVTTPATCANPGVTTYTCTGCGATKTENKPEATGEHTYGDWYRIYGDPDNHEAKCSVCDDTIQAPHEWDEGVVTTPPTCTEAGERTHKCVCGVTKIAAEPATGDHNMPLTVKFTINNKAVEIVYPITSGKLNAVIDHDAIKAWAEEYIAENYSTPSKLNLEVSGDTFFGESMPESVEDPCGYTTEITVTAEILYRITFIVDGEAVYDEELPMDEEFPVIKGEDYDTNDDDRVFGGWSVTFGNYVKNNVTAEIVWLPDINNNNIPDEHDTRYTVTYTDGTEDNVFADKTESVLVGLATPAFGEDPTRAGYVFNGWTPEVAATVTANVTYTATWGEDKNGNGTDDADDPKYTVTYTDGVLDAEVFADKTETVLVSLATPAFGENPTRAGYVFNGWTPEVAATVTDNVIYTATWGEDTNNNGIDDATEDKLVVTYTDGVEDDVFTDQVYGNLLIGYDTPEFVGTPEREHYIFKGWNPEVAETVTATVTYTAVWAEDFNDNDIDDSTEDRFTVTYSDGANGEVFEDIVYKNILVDTETPGTDIADPEREDYLFNGWDKEFAALVTENVTYTATWLPDFNHNGIDDNLDPHYDIIFTDGVEGEVVFADQSYPVLEGLASPEFDGTPAREGYVFLGWDKAFVEYPTEDITYTATWSKEEETSWVGDKPFGSIDEAIEDVKETEEEVVIVLPEVDPEDAESEKTDINRIVELVVQTENTNISVELKTDEANIVINNEAIKIIADTEGGVSIETEQVTPPEEKPVKGGIYFSFKITDINGSNVSLGQSGTMTVKVPVDTTAVTNPIILIPDEEGKLVKAESKFDEVTGEISFETNGSVDFVIVENKSAAGDRLDGFAYINESYHAMIINRQFIAVPHVDIGTDFCPICGCQFKFPEEEPADEEVVEE